MESVTWKPFAGLSTLRKEMEDLFRRSLGESAMPSLVSDGGAWVPSVNISEDKEAIMLKVELPGLESIEVSLHKSILTIRGEKTVQQEEKEEQILYRERYQGAFQRSFQLPCAVKEDKIDAAFKNGVLEIRIPKGEEAKQKQILIKDK